MIGQALIDFLFPTDFENKQRQKGNKKIWVPVINMNRKETQEGRLLLH